MLKKHSILIGALIAVSLIFIATLVYPGGSISDKNSVGFVWSKNFISNLFAEKAVNGSVNPAKIWASAGMLFLSLSFSQFFIQFSKKIPVNHAAQTIKYLGVTSMIFTLLIVTPMHDIMVTLSSTLFLISLFYITVFILKSRLHLLKFFCVICLLIFYYTLFLYGSGEFTTLAIMQKITFLSILLLILSLEYFTKKEDFELK